MVLLTQLPPEIILNILGNLDPDDLGRVPRCCRLLRNFIKGNGLLYKSVYYHTLDAPPSDAALNWEQEIQDLVRLQRVCRSSTTDKHAELRFVHDTVTRILKNASTGASRAVRSETYPSSSRNVALLTGLFQDESNREAFLSRSFLFERARGIANRFGNRPREEHQLSARLHSLYGMPQLRRGMGRTRSTSMYPFACSKVYDLREYSRATRWGPFMNDGSERVDWEKVEAILLVLRANIKGKGLDSFPIFSNLWNTPFAGSWPGSYVAWPSTERSELERQDPYDVSGTWMRVVCFLADYNDFFSYNFPLGDELPNNVPRQALDVGEATRVIMMKIHVTEIEWPEGEEGKGHPTVHFRGFSRSLDGSWDENANSDLRGLVRMTPEGEVRWTTYSIFDGEEKWKSEGIQLGGIRSARGVVGNWFDRDYDPHGPCGPTAFWKASDRSPENDDAKVMVADFLPISESTVMAALHD
ncbi:hypothetical protein QBC47DRAFT_299537 [Echria macrotheca]|uniref:F-box domain-containing protein n=1 Tax=Echria macrotheca TaxID=438768 RepID=A0AAJ0FC22_9PEZI|nr:hypothetical protein QBC47DRAFT_299537 [Echria macrotheca]